MYKNDFFKISLFIIFVCTLPVISQDFKNVTTDYSDNNISAYLNSFDGRLEVNF